jgi:bifunctional UDP-N-acetylglucosamine pyrophosphorylase/glucosamine-1-phosphate N-acetyltransferase
VRLTDCVVGDDCTVASTVGVDSEIGAGADVGPFAHLPAGSAVASGVVTGAFYTAPSA